MWLACMRLYIYIYTENLFKSSRGQPSLILWGPGETPSTHNASPHRLKWMLMRATLIMHQHCNASWAFRLISAGHQPIMSNSAHHEHQCSSQHVCMPTHVTDLISETWKQEAQGPSCRCEDHLAIPMQIGTSLLWDLACTWKLVLSRAARKHNIITYA